MVNRPLALSIAVCLMCGAVAPAAAAQADPTARSFSARFSYSMVSSGSGIGVVRDHGFGKGMIVITGHTGEATVTTCYPTGCIAAQVTVAATVYPGRSSTASGTLVISGGSGRFNRAKGEGTFAATQAADGTGTGSATGTIAY